MKTSRETRKVDGLACPFCGDNSYGGFDLPGLAGHLSGSCDAMDEALAELNRCRQEFHQAAVAAHERRLAQGEICVPQGTLCEDCPPVGYPTDKTRCLPYPRRNQ